MEKGSNKVIHYIWYGGNPISELTKKCIQTWKKFLPDFEIIEWNEKNFDVNQCAFVKEAYEQKKWAFVADYTRFKVLEEYGGIYLDTDMEITADIAKYLENDLFMGCEDSKMINAAVVWAKEAHNEHIKNLVNIYESHEHFNETGDLYEQSVPRILTKYFESLGFNKDLEEIQEFDNGKVRIYPMEYFYPLSYDYQNNKFTEKSCMIHHFDATWITPMEKFKTKMKRKNMVWVVYIIDFFVALKNKIKYFSSYKSISVFAIMFLIQLLAMFSFTGIAQESQSIWQITTFSVLWAYVTTKLINMDINKYGDKLTNTDSSQGEFRKVKFDLNQLVAFQTREKIIFVFQIILTILVAFLPMLQIFLSTKSEHFYFILLNIINTYFLYLGINKEFRFRILELIPFGAILAATLVLYPTSGILISLVDFAFILFNMYKNEVVKKRKISFIASYVVSIVIIFVIVLFTPIMNNYNAIDIGVNTQRADTLDKSLDINAVTQFDAGKTLFINNLNNITNKNSILFSNIFEVSFGLVVALLIVLITKDRRYLILALSSVLNVFYIMGSCEVAFGLSLIFNLLLVLFLMHCLLHRVLDKE